MSRYLWVLVACLTAAGMVIALSPDEAPSRDETTKDRLQEDRPQDAANEKRFQISIGGGEQFNLPDGASDWFRATLKNPKFGRGC